MYVYQPQCRMRWLAKWMALIKEDERCKEDKWV